MDLNPILDLHNRETISIGIKKRPALDLVTKFLNVRITHPTKLLYSNHGWHDQPNQWVKTLKEIKCSN